MAWQHIQSRWPDLRVQVKQRWGKLTDQDILAIDGKRDVLARKLLEYSTNTREQIEREISAFEASCSSGEGAGGAVGEPERSPDVRVSRESSVEPPNPSASRGNSQ